MIRTKNELLTEIKPGPFEGTGQIKICNLLNGSEELYGKGRVFAHITIYPGSGIGYHVHHNESETYYILSGVAKFNDNGKIKTLETGDVAYTPAGDGHSIEAIGNEPIELIALIIYK